MSLTYFVTLAHDQATRVMERKELSAVAISSSGILPLWTRREPALESFFRECNRRGVAVPMPENMESLVNATSSTGGYDPVRRNRLCGRTYRLKEEQAVGTNEGGIATLLEIRIGVTEFKQWTEMKLLSTDKSGERVELYGALPLTDYDMKVMDYSGMDFRTWLDVCVSPHYYFRCNGRCSRSSCSHPGCVSWLLFITLCLLLCFCIRPHCEPKFDPEPEASASILGQAFLWSPYKVDSSAKPSALVCGACLLRDAHESS